MTSKPKSKWKDSLPLGELVPIVHDGMFASQGEALGRMIPIAVLDAQNRPDLVEAVRSHKFLPPGDVQNEWGLPRRKARWSAVYLRLNLLRPVECRFALEFPMRKWAGFVDTIIQNEMLCIQLGEPGCKSILENPIERLNIQIGSQSFVDDWNDLLYRHNLAEFKSRGLEKREARQAARLLIAEHRKLSGFRFPG